MKDSNKTIKTNIITQLELSYPVNVCTPPSVKFEPGLYNISLKKGEALYYDISARFAEISPNRYYLIGVSNESSINLAVNLLDSCTEYGLFSKSNKPKRLASDDSKIKNRQDSDYTYYLFYMTYFSNYSLTIKAINSDINFNLKIPNGSIDPNID